MENVNVIKDAVYNNCVDWQTKIQIDSRSGMVPESDGEYNVTHIHDLY